MKLTNILTEIKEVSLPSGHASNSSTSGIVGSNIYRLLPDQLVDKYEEFDDPKVNNLGQQFVKDLIKYNKVIGQEGQYKVILNKEREEDYNFYLINTKTYLIESAIIGVIETRKTESTSYNYNLKKGFGLKAFQVHWSNIAVEYRGKGLGKVLYSNVYEYITNLGAALMSDQTLFEGSSGMWRKYMPTIASYFGAVYNDIIIPISKEDVANTKKIEDLDGFVAMEEPPKLIRKIAYNLQGLSFVNGEYGYVAMNGSINDGIEVNIPGKRFSNEYKLFDNIVDECSSLNELFRLIKYEIDQIISATKKSTRFKTAIVSFSDAVAIVKQVGDRLVVVYV